MNGQKSKFPPILLAVLIAVIITGGFSYYLTTTKKSSSTDTTSGSQDGTVTTVSPNTQPADAVIYNKEIEDAVYAAVDTSVKKKEDGTWDKKIEINYLNDTKKAAKGVWYANDQWDWIAWQKDDGKWNVLVSMDGFSCKELDTVPAEYNTFFHDVIYRLDPNKRECF